jgi:hypothetical protein
VSIVWHNAIKPEDFKMKTNRNFFSKLSKATLIVSLAFTTLVSVSCQNAAHQSFHYKPDFIKQMVYQVSSEFMSRTGLTAQIGNNNSEAAATLVNYKVIEKNMKHSSINTAELGNCLTAAAQISSSVVNEEVSEADNTLESLTEAARINAPVAEMDADQDNTLEALSNAAQLNAEVAQENNNDETIELLINAAQVNSPAVNEETSQDDLMVSLVEAARINESVAE